MSYGSVQTVSVDLSSCGDLAFGCTGGWMSNGPSLTPVVSPRTEHPSLEATTARVIVQIFHLPLWRC